jgi:hypothetical protein
MKAHKLLISVLIPLIFIKSYALEVSINGSADINLVGNIVYDYSTTPRTLSITVDAPFLCSDISEFSHENFLFHTIDGNDLSVAIFNNNIISAIYNVDTGKVDITTDPNIQCATPGDASIFRDSLEDNELRLIIYSATNM